MAEIAEKPSFVHTLLGSALSGFLARIPCHPLDTIKSRLQSSSGSRYKGILHCFQCTWAEEGAIGQTQGQRFYCLGFRGLYRGFGIVASAGAPGACVYISSYEVFKSYLTDEPMMQIHADPPACGSSKREDQTGESQKREDAGARIGVGYLKRDSKDAFRLAGVVHETSQSEMFGGQRADFLRGIAFCRSDRRVCQDDFA
eukprot:s2755_g7.t2